MAFRKPISTLGGLRWWRNIKQDEFFIMQQHKVGLPVWPYEFRIIMRENRMEIANSNDPKEIKWDWQYLQKQAIPQIEEKIDLGHSLKDINVFGIVSKLTIAMLL